MTTQNANAWWLLTGGGRLLELNHIGPLPGLSLPKLGLSCLQEVVIYTEVPTVRLWLGKFWCFGSVVACGRQLFMRGGLTWRFDCMTVVQSTLALRSFRCHGHPVNVSTVVWKTAKYMAAEVVAYKRLKTTENSKTVPLKSGSGRLWKVVILQEVPAIRLWLGRWPHTFKRWSHMEVWL